MSTVPYITLNLKLKREKYLLNIPNLAFPVVETEAICILPPTVTVLFFSNSFQLPLGKIREVNNLFQPMNIDK